MPEKIADLVGMKTLADEVFARLNGMAPASWATINGPSGVGKSWLLRNVCERWEVEKRPALILDGDQLNAGRAFYPFLVAIGSHKTSLQKWRLVRRGVAEAGKAVPFEGGLTSFILEAVLSRREQDQVRRTLYLTEFEHEILFQLQAIAGKEPLLLAMDNLQYFDSSSLKLLPVLMNDKAREVYPFLDSIRLIGAVTDDAEALSASDLARVQALIMPVRWSISRIPEARLPAVLKAFGLMHPLPPDDLAAVYRISGGHLEVLRRLVQALQESPEKGQLRAFLQHSDGGSFLETAVESRLSHLGSQGEHLGRILAVASVLGSSFSLEEFTCLTAGVGEVPADSLSRASELSLLREQGQRWHYSHEVIHGLFLRRLGDLRPSCHGALAACLARLRPGDYRGRADNLEAAGDISLAAELRFLARLQDLRRGFAPPSSTLEAVIGTHALHLLEFARAVDRAYRLYYSQDYEGARQLLESVEDLQHPRLIAEKDFIVALCLIKSLRRQDRLDAGALLQEWSDSAEIEYEQRLRLSSVLLVAQTHGDDRIAARRTERLLVKHLAQSLERDPEAQTLLHQLRRKSATLHAAEIAAERCRQAVAFFGPVDLTGIPRNPAEYFMSLTNLAGNLMMTGALEEAHGCARAALEASDKFGAACFVRIEPALTNFAVAGHLSGALGAHDAASLLDRPFILSNQSTDRPLLLNNLACLRVLSADREGGLAMLREVEPEAENDAYCRYYVQSNIAAVRFLLGERAEAEKHWRSLSESIPEIPEADRSLLVERHKLQSHAFADSAADIASWDGYLRAHFPDRLGPGWRFVGRGLLFSDLQFWSES